MSVLCCRVPDFLINLTLHRHPEWGKRPLALLSHDERVCAVSNEARAEGVRLQMRPRQAEMRCPDLLLHPLNMSDAQNEQACFEDALVDWQLPVEPQGWGMSYLDLQPIATLSSDVQPLAADLGKRLRQKIGADLQPSLGWDSGKFTARVAALSARPGRMRLVDKPQEVAFLSDLSVTLLPLPPQSLQQLYWLGIRTLGQFAKMPTTALWQRFGQAGKLAKRWAQGRDDRPVVNGLSSAFEMIEVDIDPPNARLDLVMQALLDALRPLQQTLAERLQGVRRLHLQLYFVDGERRDLELLFVDAVSDEARLSASLRNRLAALSWPAELSFVRISMLEPGELPVQQMTLFAEEAPQAAAMETLAAGLDKRYGPVFFRGRMVDAGHVVPERRAQLQTVP